MISRVRRVVADRDGYCRLHWFDAATRCAVTALFDACGGRSEWAHWGAYRRSLTRGQAPEQRHTAEGSLMLCAAHHRAYDEHRLSIDAMTARECEGPLRFATTDGTWEEP